MSLTGLQQVLYNNINLRKYLCGRNSVAECQLPKLDVGGSNPLARFFFCHKELQQISAWFFPCLSPLIPRYIVVWGYIVGWGGEAIG